MVRMPDSPAVSFAQLSVLPAPSEVTTPMPVTTTIGLPDLSRGAVMISPVDAAPCQLDRFDQGHAFAPPVAGSRPPQSGSARPDISTSSPVGSLGGNSAPREIDSAASARPSGNCVSSVWPNIVPVARTAKSGCSRRNARSSDVTGSAPVAPVMTAALVREHAELRPQRLQRLRHRARLLALREVGDHVGQARERLGAARFGMRSAIRAPGTRRRSRARSRLSFSRAQTGANLSFRLKSPNS